MDKTKEMLLTSALTQQAFSTQHRWLLWGDCQEHHIPWCSPGREPHMVLNTSSNTLKAQQVIRIFNLPLEKFTQHVASTKQSALDMSPHSLHTTLNFLKSRKWYRSIQALIPQAIRLLNTQSLDWLYVSWRNVVSVYCVLNNLYMVKMTIKASSLLLTYTPYKLY